MMRGALIKIQLVPHGNKAECSASRRLTKFVALSASCQGNKWNLVVNFRHQARRPHQIT